MSSPTLYDPLRRTQVACTPEERVRQWFIAQLLQGAGVPQHMMMSEVSLTYAQKHYRCDILIYGPGGTNLAVVECKRPEVALSSAVLEQALRYNAVLGVRFIIVTNGTSTFAYRRIEDRFEPLKEFPTYEFMIQCQQ